MVGIDNVLVTGINPDDDWVREDYRQVLGLFSEFKDSKLDIDGFECTLYTKPAFVEYNDGTVEKGLAYLLFGHQMGFAFVSEICFARLKTACEIYDIITRVKDCKSFYHVFQVRFFLSEEPDHSFRKVKIKTHLGVKDCIPYFDEYVADDAVFFCGGNLLDGWVSLIDMENGCFDNEWHVFRGSECTLMKELGIVGVDKKDYEAGIMNKESSSDIAIVEDYDDTDEFHRIAKALPFRRYDIFYDYTYHEELGYEDHLHPQEVLLFAD